MVFCFKIYCLVRPPSMCLWPYFHHDKQRLPVFFGLYLESILQPVQQLVCELAHILLLNKEQTFIQINNTGLPLEHGGQTAGLNTTYKQGKVQSVKSMSCLSSTNFGWDMTRLSEGVQWLVNFKDNLHALRPCSHTHQCHPVIQVNAYPTWLIHRGETWWMSTEARRLTWVNLCRNTGLVWMLV